MPKSNPLTLTTLLLATALLPAQTQAPTPTTPDNTLTLQVQSNIVLTDVVVRDKKSGQIVRGLQASDFTILENGKPQHLASFDFESVDQAVALNEPTISGRTPDAASVADLLNGEILGASTASLRDHRLIVLFFDLASMQPEDIDRAVQSAQDFVKSKMQPADLVAVVSLGTSLALDQDFTANKELLRRAVGKYNGTEGTGFANGGQTGSTDGTADTSSTFAVDDTEYNSLNTDRELLAIQSIAQSLGRIPERKSMLYFSGGLTRNGIENEASLRAATNAAVRANMALYTVDSRGLEALPPVGNASQGSLRGVAAYNGSSTQSQLDSNFNSQETLGTLASDTGGKFFSDSNDFAPAFQQVQRDTEAYYILGFHPANAKLDGGFRHITVRVNRPDLKLEYRPGYYAQADFKHQKTEDREQALEDQMRSDLPATDLALYLQALYFRQPGSSPNDARATVPIALVVPGSQIPFVTSKDRDKAALDILGQVKDAQGIVVGNIRDTVKLALDPSQGVRRKNIQYATSFTLAPGRYHLKFVVREDQTGNMGTFETDLNVPDLRKAPVKLSSVVLSSQHAPAPPKSPPSPLIHDGVAYLPNVAHVFRADTPLSLLYELYDPTRLKPGSPLAQPVSSAHPAEPGAPHPAPGLNRRPEGAIRVFTSLELLQGNTKVFETPLVEADTVNTPDRNAVSFAFNVPLTTLKPGVYIAQVNVIDDAGGTFTFPRLALQILPPATTAGSSPNPASALPASPAQPTSPTISPQPQ